MQQCQVHKVKLDGEGVPVAAPKQILWNALMTL